MNDNEAKPVRIVFERDGVIFMLSVAKGGLRLTSESTGGGVLPPPPEELLSMVCQVLYQLAPRGALYYSVASEEELERCKASVGEKD